MRQIFCFRFGKKQCIYCVLFPSFHQNWIWSLTSKWISISICVLLKSLFELQLFCCSYRTIHGSVGWWSVFLFESVDSTTRECAWLQAYVSWCMSQPSNSISRFPSFTAEGNMYEPEYRMNAVFSHRPDLELGRSWNPGGCQNWDLRRRGRRADSLKSAAMLLVLAELLLWVQASLKKSIPRLVIQHPYRGP
jgi:hypothetical protein